MLFILLSWIYLFTTAAVFGIRTTKWLRLKTIDPIIIVFIGCFSITLFIGFWSVFFAVNAIFYGLLFILTTIIFYRNKMDVLNKFSHFKTLFINLNIVLKVFIISIFLLILAKCASAPFIIDNETYYIQTIKWINQYGFTKGLTNLHLFLGQTSGWHILQSGFNFAFITNNLNDLSGFCLLLGNIYAINKLNLYLNKPTGNTMDLIVGLFPLFNIFIFQFIGSPSPDVAINVIGIIIFYAFASCYKTYNKECFYTVFILSIFATLIKLTGIVFFIFTLILYFYHYIYTRKNTLILLAIALITGVLFIVKNTIITGNPLYPLHLEVLQTHWSLPTNISTYFSKYEKAASYGLTVEAYKNESILKRLLYWLLQGKLDSLFNSAILLLVIVVPFFIRKFKAMQILYSVGIIFVVFLFFFSPQYRFYFSFFILFSLVIASKIFTNKSVIYVVIGLSVILPVYPMLFNFNTSALTQNKNHEIVSTFSVDHIIVPHANSKYRSTFEVVKLKNTTLHAPTAIDFIWATGDLPLPALNEKQLDYIGTYFYVIPQQYSNDLKDGFYSAPITDE